MTRMNAPDNSGFTLVELMITLVISTILMASVYTVFLAQQRSATAQQDLAIIQQDLRAAMQILTRDIRMAGFDPTSTKNFGFVRTDTFTNEGALTENVNTTNLGLACTSDLDGDGVLDTTAEDVDGNGTTDLREIEQVAYRFNAATNQLQRYSTTTGATEWQDVADNIEAIEFWYQLSDTTWTLAPTAAQIANIRSVRVSILARARFPDQSFTNTTVYTAGSGAGFNGGLPYNDNLRRRLLVLTIQCRNAGV